MIRGRAWTRPYGRAMVGAMKPVEFLTITATCLGIVATVLNLVAFVREKDRSHLKVGGTVILLLLVLVGLALLPRLAPSTTDALARRLPDRAVRVLDPWLGQADSSAPVATAPTPEPAPPGMQGAATIEIRRNLLGGIGSIVASFRFLDLSGEGGRVTAWSLDLQEQAGGPHYNFSRVLETPVTIPAGGTGTAEVELDKEIGDRWLARREAENPGGMEIRWDAQDQQGQPFQFCWGDRVSR